MQPTLCTRCKKRVAVVYISKIENGKTVNEGLCLKCAKDLGLPRQDVVFAMEAICDPVSLYDPVYSDAGESACVMDQIGDTKNTDEQWLEQIALEEAIRRLSQREKHILALRFYDGRTQMEVAKEVGISQAQVSRLEKNAIKEIKKNISA